MRKLPFCICENKCADQLCSFQTAQLISAFVFATQIGQSLYFLNPKFQASGHLLWLYSPVCVGPGWKPRRQVFLRRGSYYEHVLHLFFRRFFMWLTRKCNWRHRRHSYRYCGKTLFPYRTIHRHSCRQYSPVLTSKTQVSYCP